MVATVCISWFFFLFHFLCKMIMLLQIFSILTIWVRDFVCKLNVLFWTNALFVGGCLCNFLCLGKSRNKENKWSRCFVEKRIKKTTFEHPFSFPLPPLFIPFFSSTTISSTSNFKTQVILEKLSNDKHVKVSVVASRKFSYSLLIFLKQFHC